MQENSVIIAGFGGQGVMVTGELLAYAAIAEDKNVVWIPSYGAEMRGGTANCTVIISQDAIDSLVVPQPNGVIAMNSPSFHKFEPLVEKGGIMAVNSSLVDVDYRSVRKDIEIISVPANKIALELGSVRAANMVILGAYIERTKVVLLENTLKSIEQIISKHRSKLIEIDKKALEVGTKLAKR